MTFDENQSGFDVVIVGGGVSGSFIADELCRAGLRCVMLEAGADLSRDTYPRTELDANSQLYWGGGIEFAKGSSIGFLRAKVVGGGSIVSRAVLERFDDLAFDAWRERSGVSFLSRSALDPWYERVAERIRIRVVPEGYRNGNAEIFRQGCERNGYRYAAVQRAARDCRYQDGNCCIECSMGCRIDSKQSTPVTVLPRALEAGLTLVPQFEAERVATDSDEVTVIGRTASGARSSFRGRRLVLAAGALGNARLLLDSPLAASLPALGEHFYTHPQYMVLGHHDEPVGAHRGPVQSYTSDEPSFRRGGFKLDNVFASPVAIAMQLPGFGAAHQRWMRDITHLAGIEVVVRDTTPGRIRLGKDGRTVVDKRVNAEDRRRRGKRRASRPEHLCVDGCRRSHRRTGGARLSSDGRMRARDGSGGLGDVADVPATRGPQRLRGGLQRLSQRPGSPSGVYGHGALAHGRRAHSRGRAGMSGVQFLTPRQQRGLLAIGDVLIPGDEQFPSFSRSDCAAAADRIFMDMPQGDRDRVRRLLGLFRFIPRVVLRPWFACIERYEGFPESLAPTLRVLSLGIKRVVMTLYYSDVGHGTSVHAVMEWDPRIVDPSGETAADVPVVAQPRPERPRSTSPAVRAAEQARAGARSFARLTLDERAQRIGVLRRAVLARRESIIDHIQSDTAKTRTDALLSEVLRVVDALDWLEHDGVTHLRDQAVRTPAERPGTQSYTSYEPFGTVLVIAPWDHPFYQALVPIASALLAGNTVIHKPSEWAPLEGLIESLLAEAGFAPHWAQVVYGTGKVAATLIDQRPDKIFFTGSTRTGEKVLAQAAASLVPVELALGGKDPMIVFDDVDIRRAAAGAAWGALTDAGQSSTSVERLYVQASIYETFMTALVGEVERIKQEIDTDGDADVGVMTTDAHVRVVAGHLADALAKGGVLLTGSDWNGVSRLVPPMVIAEATDDMRLVNHETYGPVIPLLRFETEDEVVRRANDSEYGLSASVWSHDLARAQRVARRLDCGSVSINNVMATQANPALPFGGRKRSGFGCIAGVAGLRSFCQVKSVVIDKDSSKIEANWYPYTREKYRMLAEMLIPRPSPGLRMSARRAWMRWKLRRHASRARRDDDR